MWVYLDLLMLLNFVVDFLLILGTNRLSGYALGSKRGGAAALLGSLYAGACLLPGFGFLANPIWRMVSLGLMSAVAFGVSKGGFRRGVLFVLLSMALGGVASCMNRGGFWTVLLSAAGVCALCLLGFRGKAPSQRHVAVTIGYGGKSVDLTALVDTGNTLRDPVTGRAVIVADETVAWKLLAMTPQQLSHPVETMASANMPRLRLIPYSAVGSTAGLLLGIRPDRLLVDGKDAVYIVAFAPQKLGQGQYQALAGGMI